MSPGRFRQHDKLMEGRLLKFALNVVSELTEVVDALNLHVFHRTPECLSVPESQIFFYFSDRLLIGQSLRQTPAWCVCLCALNACVCECSGCWECRGVQPADPLISSLLCEVWPLSGRSTSAAVFLFTVIRWHMALTHRECCTSGKITCISDLLNSFFSEKPQRKNALAAHASLNVYPGTRLLRQRGGETFEDRYRSSAGVR